MSATILPSSQLNPAEVSRQKLLRSDERALCVQVDGLDGEMRYSGSVHGLDSEKSPKVLRGSQLMPKTHARLRNALGGTPSRAGPRR